MRFADLDDQYDIVPKGTLPTRAVLPEGWSLASHPDGAITLTARDGRAERFYPSFEHLTVEFLRDLQRAADKSAAASIPLTAHEVQSGLDRVRHSEGLIRQLPADHDGRNTWLLNYGQMALDPKKLSEGYDYPPELPRFGCMPGSVYVPQSCQDEWAPNPGAMPVLAAALVDVTTHGGTARLAVRAEDVAWFDEGKITDVSQWRISANQTPWQRTHGVAATCAIPTAGVVEIRLRSGVHQIVNCADWPESRWEIRGEPRDIMAWRTHREPQA